MYTVYYFVGCATVNPDSGQKKRRQLSLTALFFVQAIICLEGSREANEEHATQRIIGAGEGVAVAVFKQQAAHDGRRRLIEQVVNAGTHHDAVRQILGHGQIEVVIGFDLRV